jgi:hypothetical protein
MEPDDWMRCDGCGTYLASTDLLGGDLEDRHMRVLTIKEAEVLGVEMVPCGPVRGTCDDCGHPCDDLDCECPDECMVAAAGQHRMSKASTN